MTDSTPVQGSAFPGRRGTVRLYLSQRSEGVSLEPVRNHTPIHYAGEPTRPLRVARERTPTLVEKAFSTSHLHRVVERPRVSETTKTQPVGVWRVEGTMEGSRRDRGPVHEHEVLPYFRSQHGLRVWWFQSRFPLTAAPVGQEYRRRGRGLKTTRVQGSGSPKLYNFINKYTRKKYMSVPTTCWQKILQKSVLTPKDDDNN